MSLLYATYMLASMTAEQVPIAMPFICFWNRSQNMNILDFKTILVSSKRRLMLNVIFSFCTTVLKYYPNVSNVSCISMFEYILMASAETKQYSVFCCNFTFSSLWRISNTSLGRVLISIDYN